VTPQSISATPTDLDAIAGMRERYRAAAGCQIVRDSILPRGLATPWILLRGGEPAGYAGVWSEHFPGRILEAWVAPEHESVADALLRTLIRESGARAIEWQTNLPGSAALAGKVADEVRIEHLLFEDGPATSLAAPHGAAFVRREAAHVRDGDPEGPWVLTVHGSLVAAGGILTHYNEPWGDLYMAVVERERRRGFASFLVQELRRLARADGLIPAARCGPANEASRRTLLRAGMVECGRLLSGRIAGSYRAPRGSE